MFCILSRLDPSCPSYHHHALILMAPHEALECAKIDTLGSSLANYKTIGTPYLIRCHLHLASPIRSVQSLPFPPATRNRKVNNHDDAAMMMDDNVQCYPSQSRIQVPLCGSPHPRCFKFVLHPIPPPHLSCSVAAQSKGCTPG